MIEPLLFLIALFLLFILLQLVKNLKVIDRYLEALDASLRNSSAVLVEFQEARNALRHEEICRSLKHIELEIGRAADYLKPTSKTYEERLCEIEPQWLPTQRWDIANEKK